MNTEKIDLEKYSFKSLLKAVSEYSELMPEQLLGTGRLKEFIMPRHILCYLACTYTGYTLPKIGELMGRDHTTIIYAHRKISLAKRKDKDLSLAIREIHLMALQNEKKRLAELENYRDEVEEMIYRIKMEKLNGLRVETQTDTRRVHKSNDSHVSAAE